MKQIQFIRDGFTENRQGFTYHDLSEDVKEKVIQEHSDFLIQTAETEEETQFDHAYIIEHIEINSYLFDEAGELLPITTHVGKNNEVVKHTWGKNQYPCEISEMQPSPATPAPISKEVEVLTGDFMTARKKPIVYEIDRDGNIYSNSNWRGYGRRVLNTTLNSSGYPVVFLMVKGSKKKFRVHTLMAKYFLPAKPAVDSQIRHLDGNKQNNSASNLKWGTAQENAEDRDLHGTTMKGAKHGENVMRGRNTAAKMKKINDTLYRENERLKSQCEVHERNSTAKNDIIELLEGENKELREALQAVIRVADRKTVEFDKAKEILNRK